MSLFRLRKPPNAHPLAAAAAPPVSSTPAVSVPPPVSSVVPADPHTSYPLYPHCSEKLLACPGWLCGLSVFRALGNKAAQLHLRRRLQKADASLGLQIQVMTVEWSPATQQWYPLPAARQPQDYHEWAVKVTQLRQFVSWALLRSRKTREEKLRLFAVFDLTLSEAETEAVTGPVENEVLAVLSQCLPFKIEYQYRVGAYRLDAFIPRLRLAVQIDEHGHRGYDAGDEKAYDEALRDNNIVCLRFNPDQTFVGTSPAHALVRQVWERTLSPDFGAFREKHQLN